MLLKDRLLELIKLEGLNPNQFYIKTGLGIGFLDKVGEKLKRPSVEKISRTFPSWNIEYIQEGKGEMIVPNTQHNAVEKNNGIVGINGNGNKITNNEMVEILKLQECYLDVIKKKDEQIDRLLSIIENQNKK